MSRSVLPGMASTGLKERVQSMSHTSRPIVTDWNSMPLQAMRMGMTRRFVHSDNMMVAQVNFCKDDFVPAHSHDNEQFTYVLTGALEFKFGDEQSETMIVRAGSIVFIPSMLVHSAFALEDTFELDIFNPPRQDWLDGSDGYMRR